MVDNKRRAQKCTYDKITRNMMELPVFAKSYVIGTVIPRLSNCE